MHESAEHVLSSNLRLTLALVNSASAFITKRHVQVLLSRPFCLFLYRFVCFSICLSASPISTPVFRIYVVELRFPRVTSKRV